MRRVLLFAALLLLLGLTTATAASFDVQAEDITSFSQAVDIDVPAPPPPPAYYLNGSAPLGMLVYPKPAGQSAVETGKFQRVANLEGENRQPEPGQVLYFMRWASAKQVNGLTFSNKKIRLDLYSPGQFSGTVSAGLYSCPATPAGGQPVLESACSTLIRWDGAPGALTLTSGPFSGTVAPDHELRLKIANTLSPAWTAQWGYKDQNRFASFSILGAGGS